MKKFFMILFLLAVLPLCIGCASLSMSPSHLSMGAEDDQYDTGSDSSSDVYYNVVPNQY